MERQIWKWRHFGWTSYKVTVIDKENKEFNYILNNDYPDNFNSFMEIIEEIKGVNIEIIPFNEKHLRTYANLDIRLSENKDPNDHIIIAQAISDRMPLISSDRDFKNYTSQGLEFVFNKR